MSDKRKIAGSGGGGDAFERDLAISSHAYKHTDDDLPPPALNDAIRAAARRAVKSKPHTVEKSWVSRWSAPISVAALVMLTVSVVLTGIEEKPELAPASVKEISLPKAAAPAATEADVAPSRRQAEASNSTQLAPPVEQKTLGETRNTAPLDQGEKMRPQDTARRRNDAGSAGDAAVAVDAKTIAASPSAKEKRDTLAENAPSPAAPAAIAPATPLAKDVPGFAAAPPPAQLARSQEPVAVASAEQVKREEAQERPSKSALVAGAAAGSIRNEASVQVAKKLIDAAAPAYVSGTTSQRLADKATEPPEVWLKRIQELKKQGKTREVEEELARFRKRYPDFTLPKDLTAAK